MKPTFFLALTLLTPAFALSQADQKLAAAIDDIADAALKEGPLAGISIAVTRGNQTLILKGYGKSNLELDTSTTPNTLYHIDSITKNLTAAAVVQLAEQHKLNLDDLVEKYVPQIHAIAPDATVRSLMNHTSGIPDITQVENIEAVPFTHKDFLAAIQGVKPQFLPTQSWRYNNSGFYLLGLIIEKVSGETYADYMANHIFKPLGMSSTLYCDGRSVVKNRAAGYDRSKGHLVNAQPMTWNTPYSAGGLCSNVSDLIIWQRALNRGNVISEAGLSLMRSPTVLSDGIKVDYGLGTRRGDLQGHRIFGHTGTGGGFNDVLEYYPDEDLTIVVLMNSDTSVTALNIAGDIARAVLSIPSMPVSEHLLSESEIVGFSGQFESEEGSVSLSGDHGHMRVKFDGGGSSSTLIYLGEDAFAAGPDMVARFYVKNGAAQGAAVYAAGLFVDAKWRVPAN